MSYILDALRKSEQQRQRGITPSLFTAPVLSDVEKRPAFLLYALVAAILISAGILIGWLRPWQQEGNTAPATYPIPPGQHALEPPAAAPSQPVLLEPEMSRKFEQRLLAQKSRPVPPAQSRSDTGRLAKDATPTTREEAPPRLSRPVAAGTTVQPETPVRPADVPATTTGPKDPLPQKALPIDDTPDEKAPEQKVITMAELPPAIQKEIPAMSISVHAYSSIPKERIVGINDHLLQEGEYLAQGLRLEQITPDGLVFSYKKYQFRYGLQ